MKKKYRFHRIYIEITNICNLHCSFCPEGQRKKQLMRSQDFECIASKLAGQTGHISLHVKGEPMLHPELAEILAIAKRYGLQISLTTNGTLLPERGKLLMGPDAPRQVSLSLHSFDANDMHQTDFETYIDGAIQFAKAYAALTPGYLSFRLWNLDGSVNEDQRARNRQILESLEKAYGLEAPVSSRTKKYTGNAIAPRTYINFDRLFEWPSMEAPDYGEKGSCYGLRRQLGILADGTVVPCCLDGEGNAALGNLLQQDLDEILDSPLAKAMLQGFEQEKIVHPLCRRCEYRTRF